MCTLDHTKHYSGDGPQYLPFPQETLVQIIGYLDKACDRGNARLACKGFAEAGLPSLTYTVNLSIAGGLLDRAQAIVQHPVVAKYITQMVCSGTQLLSGGVNSDNFTAWYGSMGHRTEIPGPLSNIYEQFVSRDEKEKRVIHSGLDETTFLLALRELVNLERITFTDVPLVEANHDLARPQWPGVESAREVWERASPYQMLDMLIQSLCTRGTDLQQLKIVGSSYAVQDTIFSNASEQRYGHMLKVFDRLRYFELSVIVPDVPIPEDAQPLAYGSLGDLLIRAKFLSALKLISSYWPEPPNEDDCPPMLDIATLLQGFRWRHLKHLTLRGFLMIGHEDLLHVFDRHRATLESVELMAVRILHHPDPQDTICEAWKHLFDGLQRRGIIFRTLIISVLQDCYNLDGHFTQPDNPAYHGEKMLKYLRQGGINPLEPALPDSDDVA